MVDAAKLEEKIRRLKKTLSEKREKKSETGGSVGLRTFRKQLKRLQRRRRVLLNFAQRGTKIKAEKSEKESKPVPKPAADKEAKAG